MVYGANVGYALKPLKLVLFSKGFKKKSTISEHFLFWVWAGPKASTKLQDESRMWRNCMRWECAVGVRSNQAAYHAALRSVQPIG